MNTNQVGGTSGNGQGRGNHNLGNERGFQTRFVRGRSGNPGGRPRRTPFTDAIRMVADLSVRDMKIKQTDPVPVAIAKRLVSEALNGKTQAAVELANRAEGTPPRRVEVVPEQEIRIRVMEVRKPIKNPAALRVPPSDDTNPQTSNHGRMETKP